MYVSAYLKQRLGKQEKGRRKVQEKPEKKRESWIRSTAYLSEIVTATLFGLKALLR
jgi:hypothetical protein